MVSPWAIKNRCKICCTVRWAQPPLPLIAAYLLTFVVSGAIHDLVIMALRRTFTLIFTPWFLLLGLGALTGRAAGLDLSAHPWWLPIALI